MDTVYLSLGSNLGNREAHLRDALARLEAAQVQVLRRSSVYETEPQDLRNQPWFLNLVVEAETRLFPLQLLARLQDIEHEMGRRRITPKGPRTIDLDILFFGTFVIHTKELQVPHPRLDQRRFVLEPLAEIAPSLRHPVTGRTAREMLAAVEPQTVRRVNVSL
ncbi:MAG TPA: 2-amino-4-hydroxy-6-hydroxymethyldihydropteridine diphosphokinase [Bryobacteraceae bacterium]|nr:2-amino-4-hydroxy-6-hydroxymethyldihydropteridine diphosphokinase [Bryobacteraceae bacterium]